MWGRRPVLILGRTVEWDFGTVVVVVLEVVGLAWGLLYHSHCEQKWWNLKSKSIVLNIKVCVRINRGRNKGMK